MLLLNGAAGGWDELAIALVALGVLWIAVKLAGRKPAGDATKTRPTRTTRLDEEHADPASSAVATPRG